MYKNTRILALAMFVLFAVAHTVLAQTDLANVHVTPENAQVVMEQTITISVDVNNITDLLAFDIQLDFDPTVIEVLDAAPSTEGVQVSLGTFVDPGFVVLNEADNTAGTIRLAMSQMGADAAKSGSGTLIVFDVRAKTAGKTSPLTFTKTQLVLPAGAGEIPVTTTSGTIEVITEADLTPQPTFTPVPTQEPSIVDTPVPTATWTPSPLTPTPTRTPRPEYTSTATPSATATGTTMPRENVTATATATATGSALTVTTTPVTATATRQPDSESTHTPSPTATEVATSQQVTPTPQAQQEIVSVSATDTPSLDSTNEPTLSVTSESTKAQTQAQDATEMSMESIEPLDVQSTSTRKTHYPLILGTGGAVGLLIVGIILYRKHYSGA